ncbi:MAG: hypothetical protein O7A03_01360 [Alphaproteobacteria bacterium]|nr:hypothetical protein [Alphaproteobacteria bacterium]
MRQTIRRSLLFATVRGLTALGLLVAVAAQSGAGQLLVIEIEDAAGVFLVDTEAQRLWSVRECVEELPVQSMEATDATLRIGSERRDTVRINGASRSLVQRFDIDIEQGHGILVVESNLRGIRVRIPVTIADDRTDRGRDLLARPSCG